VDQPNFIENLARYRYHTGGSVRPVAPDEDCPILFRDIGPIAMARFLRGQLRRLCGQFSPVTYLRTANYREPYTDYGQIGRIIVLQPLTLSPWHSGVDEVYIASKSLPADLPVIGFLPPDVACIDVAQRLSLVRSVDELAEEFGPAAYVDARNETLFHLDHFNREAEAVEVLAAPLRKRFQSSNQHEREVTRTAMQRCDLTESDLCTAWHHLPAARRALIRDILRDNLQGGALC
jgi:hypothetical protein